MLDDGTEVVADEAYIRRSITDPSAQVVAGFNVQMPEIELSDDDVDALVAYITTLGDGSTPD
jgi:cytochrome c oxidase subunit 2